MNTTDFKQGRFHRFNRYYSSLIPMLEKPKTQVYTAIIFSFLAISLFIWYAIRPTIQIILILRKDIADKTIVNQKMEQKIANLISVRSTIDSIQDKLYLMRDAIPENPDIIDLTTQIKNITASSNASISSMTVSNVPLVASDVDKKNSKTSKVPEFTLDMTLEGEYADLINILDKLNTMRRLILIEQMNIDTGKSQTSITDMSKKTMRLSFHARSYYK